MTPRTRANRTIFNAINLLTAKCRQFSTMDIARVSTYSQPTVIRAIQELEKNGIISVERQSGKHNHYTILAEMPDQDGAPRC